MVRSVKTVMVKAEIGASGFAKKEDETTAASPVARVLAGQVGIQDWQEDLYRTIHQHPALGNQEVKTAAAAADSLRKSGYMASLT